MDSSENKAHELLTRLLDLERQLYVLRSELGACSAPSAIPTGTFQALRVAVAEEVYGIPIQSVREILRYVELTKVAEAPRVVAGAINVRGNVCAVVDARLCFDHPAREPRLGTAIVLVHSGSRSVGLVVDHVLEIVSLSPAALAPASAALTAGTVAALATVDDRVLQLIDVDRISAAVDGRLLNHEAQNGTSSDLQERGGL